VSVFALRRAEMAVVLQVPEFLRLKGQITNAYLDLLNAVT